MPSLSSRPFPFVYQCRECGRGAVVTRADADKVEKRRRPRLTADAALQNVYGWTQARPASICPECGE
jgi:hypothetical protein